MIHVSATGDTACPRRRSAVRSAIAIIVRTSSSVLILTHRRCEAFRRLLHHVPVAAALNMRAPFARHDLSFVSNSVTIVQIGPVCGLRADSPFATRREHVKASPPAAVIVVPEQGCAGDLRQA